jgi:hypothetical protein
VGRPEHLGHGDRSHAGDQLRLYRARARQRYQLVGVEQRRDRDDQAVDQGSDSAAPTTPANLSGFDGGCGEAWLHWDASTDNVDLPLAIRYDVYVNGVLRPESTVIGGTSTVAYAAIEGPNTFELYAVDTAGNRSVPAAVTMDLTGLCQ